MISMKLKNKYVKRLSNRKNRGLTLMEVAMVLAIIGIIIAGALLYFNTANTSQKITSSLAQLAQIQQSVRTLYSGQANYSGLTTALIAQSDALPASMISGSTISHAFNAGVTVTANTTSSTNFDVVFSGLPQDVCKQMLTKDLGRGLVSAGTTVATQTQPSLPFNLTQATAACTGTTNAITWVFN